MIARLGPFRLVITTFSDSLLANGLGVSTVTHMGGGGWEKRRGEFFYTRCNLSAKIFGMFGLCHDTNCRKKPGIIITWISFPIH